MTTRTEPARAQVWNVNRYSGIVGAFHLQGASWSRTRRQFLVHDETPPPLATQARCRPTDRCPTFAPQKSSVITQLHAIHTTRCVRLPVAPRMCSKRTTAE